MRTRFLTVWSVFALLLVMVLLAACGGGASVSTPFPTATATPRSTPLPPLPTAVPLASEMQPLPMLILESKDQGNEAGEAFSEALSEQTGLIVIVEYVSNYGQAVDRLCGADPVVAWLDGLSYGIADAQGCVEPVFLGEQDGETGIRAELLLSADLAEGEDNEPSVELLTEGVWCQAADAGPVMLLLSDMMLRSSGLDPLSLAEVLEVDDYDAMVEAIYDGQCGGGLVPAGYLTEGIGEDLQDVDDLTDKVLVVDSSPELPLAVLVYPPTVPLNVRIPLSEWLETVSADRGQQDLLSDVVGVTELVPVERATFEKLTDFMASTGLDFAVLGE